MTTEEQVSSWQYGVMFHDDSVSRSWNGITQEQQEEYATQCRENYPNDNIRVVRRLIGPWEDPYV